MQAKNKNIKFRDYLLDKLSDKDYRKKFLQIALDDYLKEGDYYEFLAALKTLAEAKGGISKLSKSSGLSRQALYKIFSDKGNPEFITMVKILNEMGLKLSITSK